MRRPTQTRSQKKGEQRLTGTHTFVQEAMADSSPEANGLEAGNDELAPIDSIWDDPYIVKSGRKGSDSEQWHCRWCNKGQFRKWNASKALHHVAKVKGKHISVCMAAIHPAYAKRYKALLDNKTGKKESNKRAANRAIEFLDDHNEATSDTLQAQRKRSRKTANTLKSSPASTTASPGSLASDIQGVPRGYVQTDLTGGSELSASATARLTMAIADFVHANGLSFSIVEKPRFEKMLSLARFVGGNYKLPSRKAVSGELLDLNYRKYLERNKEELMKEADVFGLSFMGDGATVKRMPLVNILCSGKNAPASVLEIVDCTGHLAGGGKKDARFIAGKYQLTCSVMQCLNQLFTNCLLLLHYLSHRCVHAPH